MTSNSTHVSLDLLGVGRRASLAADWAGRLTSGRRGRAQGTDARRVERRDGRRRDVSPRRLACVARRSAWRCVVPSPSCVAAACGEPWSASATALESTAHLAGHGRRYPTGRGSPRPQPATPVADAAADEAAGAAPGVRRPRSAPAVDEPATWAERRRRSVADAADRRRRLWRARRAGRRSRRPRPQAAHHRRRPRGARARPPLHHRGRARRRRRRIVLVGGGDPLLRPQAATAPTSVVPGPRRPRRLAADCTAQRRSAAETRPAALRRHRCSPGPTRQPGTGRRLHPRRRGRPDHRALGRRGPDPTAASSRRARRSAAAGSDVRGARSPRGCGDRTPRASVAAPRPGAARELARRAARAARRDRRSTMLEVSDNEGAEVLGHQVGARHTPAPSFAGGGAGGAPTPSAASGIDLAGAEIYDGSGLSRHDRLAAAHPGRRAPAAARPTASPSCAPWSTGLPVAAFTGSLAYRFDAGAPRPRPACAPRPAPSPASRAGRHRRRTPTARVLAFVVDRPTAAPPERRPRPRSTDRGAARAPVGCR